MNFKNIGRQFEGLEINSYNKNSKPDSKDNTQSIFSSIDTFMNKEAYKRPSVNLNFIQSYYPNIYSSKTFSAQQNLSYIDESKGLETIDQFDEIDDSADLESEYLLDELLKKSTLLSGGEVILHLSLEGVAYNLQPSNKPFVFTLSSKVIVPNSKVRSIPIVETDVKKDRGLYSGSIKKIGNNQYEVTSFVHPFDFLNNKTETKVMSASEVWDYMQNSGMSTYSN